MSNTLAGLPFALVCAGILVYCVLLLLGTLAIERRAARESDEEGRSDLRAVIVAAALLLALLSRYGR